MSGVLEHAWEQGAGVRVELRPAGALSAEVRRMPPSYDRDARYAAIPARRSSSL